MIIVLDSNEYLYFLNKEIFHLENVLKKKGLFILIHRIIREEVLRNLTRALQSRFHNLILDSNIILNSDVMPNDFLNKYMKLGLKKGDIAISAFCDYINADYLITENRHFLKSKNIEEFKILNLKDFLKLIQSSS